MDRLDPKGLIRLIDEQQKHVERFQNTFMKTTLKEMNKGYYRASLLLRDYRIVEVKEYIPDFNPDIVLGKLQMFVATWYPASLALCVALPVRAPISRTLFNNYLIISCETSFYGKGKVYQIQDDNSVIDITEDEHDSVITARAILTDSAVRPYLSLFHYGIAHN